MIGHLQLYVKVLANASAPYVSSTVTIATIDVRAKPGAPRREVSRR